MASFDEHIDQAKKNLKFLESVVLKIDDEHWDWKVTICFYVSVHLVNAHLSKFGHHYRIHKDVELALNPKNQVSVSKLDDINYLQYLKLRNLSRRSRYLCHDAPDNQSSELHLTFDKHFSKAIKNLDGLMEMMKSKYNVSFNETSVRCIELRNYKSHFFKVA